MRVLQRFGWAHSIALGGDLRRAWLATPRGGPFIVHACEGVSKEASDELLALDRQGLLDSSTVLVHGLALDDERLAVLQARQASLILCPSSNEYLFGRLPANRLFYQGEKVALGSDSPLTSAGDLLDEVRFAMLRCAVPAERAYAMVTDTPRSILRLENGEGSIQVGGVADLIGIRDTGSDILDRLGTLSSDDVELVMLGGCVQLASDELYRRLPMVSTRGLESLRIGGSIRWLRAPVAEMVRSAEAVMGFGKLLLGGRPIELP
ncbi:amidohydrolase family protein [Acidipila sp. EB88]|uniref:amidohydrolase family protein n=1 Tax=Acidipila sp. EB88 TaxID=2305226 RepID=UPI0013152E88|nr:amidohydrolase family protein [Acidipila sp. EB88]